MMISLKRLEIPNLGSLDSSHRDFVRCELINNQSTFQLFGLPSLGPYCWKVATGAVVWWRRQGRHEA